MTDRFSPELRELLQRNEHQLEHFSKRIAHLLSVDQELIRVTRKKLFLLHQEAMWQMLLGETDMVIVDLASWALGFYEKGGGGLLRSLRGEDLEALRLKWKYEATPVINADGRPHPDIDAHFQKVNREWREKAFKRLFPEGTSGSRPNVPCQRDVDGLCDRLAVRFEALHQDRNQHRAHRYEKGAKTAAMLGLEDVTKHLEACQDLLAEIRCLSSNSQFAAYRYRPEAHRDDHDAQDVVDIIVLGNLREIIDAQYGPKTAQSPEPGYYHQRRNPHYDRLHRLDDESGEPEKPFNDWSLIALEEE